MSVLLLEITATKNLPYVTTLKAASNVFVMMVLQVMEWSAQVQLSYNVYSDLVIKCIIYCRY